jgi:Tetratricopeptide repeat
MRSWIVIAFGLTGCGGTTHGDDTTVAEVAITAEPASTGEEPRSEPTTTPRRAAEERPAKPSSVPPSPDASPADIQKARALFQTAVIAVENGDYTSAENAFEEAYSLVPKPQILFNLARVYMLEGRTQEACATYERYWMTLSPPDPSKRAELPVAQCPNLANLP